MSSASPHLSIIIPCYNPLHEVNQSIRDNFRKIKTAISNNAELIIVNDGSTKNFIEKDALDFFANEPDVKIISYANNKGKGYALRKGVKLATSDLIVYTDVDFPYTFESFLKIYSLLVNDEAVVAMGIRNHEYYTHIPTARAKVSKLLRFLIKKFLRIPTDDTQCGLKGFNQKGKEIFLQTTINRYLFDLEFIFLAARKGLPIKTVEVELRPGIELSTMPWKILLQEAGNFFKIFAKSLL